MDQSLQLALLASYFAAVLALIALMLGLSHLLGQRHRAAATAHPFESGVMPVGNARVKFPAQFYLIAMFFVIFDLETAFLYAWAIVARQAGWAGYFEVLVFIAILLAALIYLWRVGALNWTPPRSRSRRSS